MENRPAPPMEVKSGFDSHMPVRLKAILWNLQAYGLMGITFLSFMPRFFRYQEHVFFLLLAIALYLAWTERHSLRTPIDLPLLGFVFWVLLTVPFAYDPAYSFSEWRKVVASILVFYWTMFVLRNTRDADLCRRVLWTVVLGSLVLSGSALVDFILHGGTWRDRVVRAGAPNSDYNWLTTYLVLVIPVLIGWVVIHKTFWARLPALLTLVIAIVAQIASYTRAGWMAHFIQGIAFGLMEGKRRVIVWILVGAIMIGGGLVAVSQKGYQQDTVDPWTLSARVKTWQLGLREAAEHPLVGIGYGNNTFLKVHAAEVEAEKDKGAVEKVLPALHSTFAMVLMGSGVPALAFFVWIMVRIIQELALGAREPVLRRTGLHMIRMMIALSVVGFVVRNAFDYMFAGSLASLFWILVATGLTLTGTSLGRRQDQRQEVSEVATKS